MLILYCQSEHLTDGGPRSYRKYIVLDEFWALLAVPMVADLVITGLRTLRKYHTAIICISQLVRDFTTTEPGRVVLSASQHRILLRQPPDVIAELDKHFNWSAEQQGLMYSVVSAKGLFSEALIDIPNQGISEVARFVPTPYAYWIFTTAPEDVKQRDAKRNELRAEGHSQDSALDLALRACAERWPHGFAAGEKKS
jgi:conjugal transfer ATP-binding protein TraC